MENSNLFGRVLVHDNYTLLSLKDNSTNGYRRKYLLDDNKHGEINTLHADYTRTYPLYVLLKAMSTLVKQKVENTKC